MDDKTFCISVSKDNKFKLNINITLHWLFIHVNFLKGLAYDMHTNNQKPSIMDKHLIV